MVAYRPYVALRYALARGRGFTPQAAAGLPAFQVGIDTIQIIAVLCGIGITRGIDLSEHFVFPRLLLIQALPGCR
jgi:hypothetical protein